MIAAITAGGRVDGALAEAIGTTVKALAPIGRETLLDRAIAAARGAGAGRIVVIGGADVRQHCGSRVHAVIDERPDGRDNIRLAIEAAGDRALLLMTSDLPFITSAATAEFLARAASSDLALPLAAANTYASVYPRAPDHITSLGNARVANGSIVYFAPGVAPRVLDVAQQLFEARKSLWRMAVLLGPALLTRFAFRRLEIAHVERRANAVLGISARAVYDAAPSLCFDVDSLEDYRYAVEHDAHG